MLKFKLKTALDKTPDFFDELLKFKPIRIDDVLFGLHYKLSVMIITFTYCMLIHTVCNYAIISCIFSNGVSDVNWDLACFVTSIYSNFKFSTEDLNTYPGVMGSSGSSSGSETDLASLTEKDTPRYHKYYQYIPFILIIQIIIFITPRYLWRSYEDGKMKTMCEDFDKPLVDKEDTEYITRKKQVAEYFVAGLGYNNDYAFVYALSEVLNLVGVVFQMYFLDLVTGGVLSTYGPGIVTHLESGKLEDPFSKSFPTMVNCTFNIHGPGGNIIPNSGVCTIPLNLVAKGYMAYFSLYLLVLAILNVINIIYRIVTVASFQLRISILKELCDFTGSGTTNHNEKLWVRGLVHITFIGCQY